MLQETTDEKFAADISEGSVLVDFWAPWCGPCRMVHPVLEQIDKERSDLKIVSLNVDENQRTAAEFAVMSIPTMIVFKDGKVQGKIVGAHPKGSLESEIDRALG